MPTTEAEVLRVLAALTAVGASPRVAGGWGVDALAGRQTRDHRDLDVMVLADRLGSALEALRDMGYEVSTDWLPVRVEVAAGDRHVDLHPLNPSPDGGSWQAGLDGARFDYPAEVWTTGRIGGHDVSCLTAPRQRDLHGGYQHRAEDRHDLAVLDDVLTADPSTA